MQHNSCVNAEVISNRLQHWQILPARDMNSRLPHTRQVS